MGLLGFALVGVLAALVPVTTALPDADAVQLEFEDIDTREGFLAGTALITRASNETTLTLYAIYFSTNTTSPASKLILDLGYPHQAVMDNIFLPDAANPAHPSGKIRVLIPPTAVPAGANSLIVLSKNADGTKEDTACILEIVDVTSQTLPLCANTTLTFPSGAFDDGSGDANYTSAVELDSSYSCVWSISNPNVTKFLFIVTFLDLDEYLYDSLCVYDGDGERTEATKLQCYDQGTGAATAYNVISTTNSMQVVLDVQGSVSAQGFRAVYYGLDTDDFENSVDDNVMTIRYDQHIPTNCHCTDVSCQGQASNCFVDEGNGKGWSTCNNLGTCAEN